MAILTEVWARDIAEKLFPNDSFVMQAVSDDAWINNKRVHRSQAGSLPGVAINRSVFPAVSTSRTDTDEGYDMDEITTDPTHIRDIEEIEVSYAKRQSVLQNHINVINLKGSNAVAYRWAPTLASGIIRTTGDLTPANTPGATGDRKKLTLEDLMKAKNAFDDQDIPSDGRNILIPASMYNQLVIDEKTVLMSNDFRSDATIKDGNIVKIFGFNIFTRGRENVLRYSNAATPVVKNPDAAGAATDNAAILCWHKDFVSKAKGAVKIYSQIDVPGYYGSVFSAMARVGGQKMFTGQNGVLAIVEGV
jgi:hypothetical protein